MHAHARRILICLFAAALAAPAAAQESRTVVILVRHAERATEPAGDPGLTPRGQARAAELAEVLADAGVSAIYSTQYQRTRQTADSVARRLGLQVHVDPATGNVDEHSRNLASRILEQHAGRTVLVVGHSNTVPALARAFGAADPGPIEDHEYHDLVIVVVGPGNRRDLIRARY